MKKFNIFLNIQQTISLISSQDNEKKELQLYRPFCEVNIAISESKQ